MTDSLCKESDELRISRHNYRSIIRDTLKFTPDCDLCGGGGSNVVERCLKYRSVCSLCGGLGVYRIGSQ